MSYAGADIKPAPRPNVSPRVGHIVSVSGAQAVAVMERSPTVHHRVEIGSTLSIPTPNALVIGIVSAVSVPMADAASGAEEVNLIELNLAGEILLDPAKGRVFRRGVSSIPTILRQHPEALQRLVVSDRDVLCPSGILHPGVFGADTGIVQAGRDRMGVGNLPVLVLQKVGQVAVQYTGRPGAERCCMSAGINAVSGRFDTDHADILVLDERIEQTESVAAACPQASIGLDSQTMIASGGNRSNT